MLSKRWRATIARGVSANSPQLTSYRRFLSALESRFETTTLGAFLLDTPRIPYREGSSTGGGARSDGVCSWEPTFLKWGTRLTYSQRVCFLFLFDSVQSCRKHWDGPKSGHLITQGLSTINSGYKQSQVTQSPTSTPLHPVTRDQYPGSDNTVHGHVH